MSESLSTQPSQTNINTALLTLAVDEGDWQPIHTGVERKLLARDGGEESARSRREAGGGGAAAGLDRPVREAWPEHRDPANRYLRYFATRKKTVEPRSYLLFEGGGLRGPPCHTVNL